MDARKYDAIHHVSVSQFDKDQRQRLEAFTAAVKLKPNTGTMDQLGIAQFIFAGAPDQ